MFVLKQYFIITKSLPEPNDLVNEAQKDYIKSLLDHTEYLKEENKMKTTIIVSLGHSIDIKIVTLITQIVLWLYHYSNDKVD